MKLNLGENIRRLRRQRDWTQDELADRLGTTSQSVSRWENGSTYPDMEFLPELADLFSVTVDALLGVDTGSTGYVSAEGRQQLGEDALAKLAETYERLQKGEIVPPTTADGVNDFPGLK
jgi:transcriptional regulator with XRE-family HTH domain